MDQLVPFTLPRKMSLRQIAAELATEGEKYARTLATMNGYANTDAQLPAGAVVYIDASNRRPQ